MKLGAAWQIRLRRCNRGPRAIFAENVARLRPGVWRHAQGAADRPAVDARLRHEEIPPSAQSIMSGQARGAGAAQSLVLTAEERQLSMLTAIGPMTSRQSLHRRLFWKAYCAINEKCRAKIVTFDRRDETLSVNESLTHELQRHFNSSTKLLAGNFSWAKGSVQRRWATRAAAFAPQTSRSCDEGETQRGEAARTARALRRLRCGGPVRAA
jgi:hypothetical protein